MPLTDTEKDPAVMHKSSQYTEREGWLCQRKVCISISYVYSQRHSQLMEMQSMWQK